MSSSSEEDEVWPDTKKNVASAMLGVFAEEDEGPKRKRTHDTHEKPMTFVSASSSIKESKRKNVENTTTTSKAPEWERYTKGIGSALLQKMGYKGKLGKDENIITKPIQVEQRPDGMGLGFSSNSEKQRQHETPEAKRVKKNRYKVIQHRQVLQKVAHQVAQSLVAKSIQETTVESREVVAGKRLLEAIEAALNGEAVAERDALQRYHTESERGLVLKAELKKSLEETHRFEMESARLHRFVSEIETMKIEANSAQDAQRILKKWHAHFKRELTLTGADSFAYWLDLEPKLRLHLEQSADILNECTHLLEEWRQVFPQDKSGFVNLCCALIENTQSVRRALSDPQLFKEPARRAAALRLCMLLQASSATPAILNAVLLPRLVKWFDEDQDEASFAALEWLPVIGNEIDNPKGFEQGIACAKKALEVLKRRLDRMSISGPFERDVARSFLRLGLAWRQVLSGEQYRQSWKRFVLYSLPSALAKALDPRLLRSLGLGLGLPDTAAALLIQDQFGPRFLEAMHRLLSDGRHFLALALYLDWRQAVLSEHQGLPVLGEKARRNAYLVLTKALDLIELAALGDDMNSFEPHIESNVRVDEERFFSDTPEKVSDMQVNDDSLFAASDDNHHQQHVTFTDVVTRFAQDNDLVFAPKLGRSLDGKQVYSFGTASIYIDKDVIFIFDPTKQTWNPISLEDLLSRQRQKIF
uniref:G-patch domain-containing protein n=1 Tax=Aureoumbra lagunensis TaxID=44058 RepID=A0A7S3JUS2_9STRA|mmetsp:Transcript_10065/g.15273  ORF Transcript_10065/g.15273 Transcript_10065/m.15273 type:complete len:701 (-) Transcript_10065:1988-4090(-)